MVRIKEDDTSNWSPDLLIQTRSTVTNLRTAIIVSTFSDFEQAMSREQHINTWQNNNIIEQYYTNTYKCGERMDINSNHAFDSAYTEEQASICIPVRVKQTQTRILMLPVYSATGWPYHHTDLCDRITIPPYRRYWPVAIPSRVGRIIRLQFREQNTDYVDEKTETQLEIWNQRIGQIYGRNIKYE